MQGQEVAAFHQLIPGNLPHLPRELAQLLVADLPVARGPRGEEHLHPEAERAAGGGAGDPAEPGQAQHRAGDVPAQQQLRFPAVEVAVADQPVCLHHAAGGAEDEQHGDVRRRVRQYAGGVAHQDAVPGGGVHVDVVVSDREVGHALHPRAGQERGIDDVAQLGEDDVVLARGAQRRQRVIVGRGRQHGDRAGVGQQLQARGPGSRW